MTFFQMLGLFWEIYQLWRSPEREFSLYAHCTALPMRGEPELEGRRASYRILKNGIPIKTQRADFRNEGALLLEKPANLPLISCLMVTKNRAELAKKAIQCFVEQTYPNKELIVLDQGMDSQLRDWMAGNNFGGILYEHLADESIVLGRLRNMSRERAKGDFIATWDDDDLSHPDRLLYQMVLIQKHKLDGCSLQREELIFTKQNRHCWTNRRFWEHSFIVAPDKITPYFERPRNEEADSTMLSVMSGRVALLDFPQLYTYCFHGENTYDTPHFDRFWKGATRVFS